MIEFPDPAYGPPALRAGETHNRQEPTTPRRTQRGFAIGRILYEDGTVGTLIYIKPALTKNLSPEILSYDRRSPRFPHESTADQFFDEIQFEAYRELGVALGGAAAEHILLGSWRKDRWHHCRCTENDRGDTRTNAESSEQKE